MADLAHVSNPYLSQLERGLHEPSVRVLQSIARALNVSAETLLAHAGLDDDAVGGRRARHRVGHPRRRPAVRRAEAGVALRVPQLRAGQRRHRHVTQRAVSSSRSCPGASPSGGAAQLPIDGGAGAARPPARPATGSSRSTRCRGARSRRPATSSASRGSSSLVQSRTFGLGGFTMPAMWPPDVSTKRIGPLNSCVVRYDTCHGTMWSSTPATM